MQMGAIANRGSPIPIERKKRYRQALAAVKPADLEDLEQVGPLPDSVYSALR